HALLELTKGKLTTDPQHHTGEGIFFTSRMLDKFSILSSGLYFEVQNHEGHNQNDPWLVEAQNQKDGEERKGTFISMTIGMSSQRTPKEIFDKYTASDAAYDFSRTQVPISLARYGEEQLVSRSQARRALARFEKFREVILDFDGIATIGHSF